MPWSPPSEANLGSGQWSTTGSGRQRSDSVTKANIDLANQCGRALSQRKRTRQNKGGVLSRLWFKVVYEWLAARRLRLFVRTSSLVVLYLGIGIAYYSSTQVSRRSTTAPDMVAVAPPPTPSPAPAPPSPPNLFSNQSLNPWQRKPCDESTHYSCINGTATEIACDTPWTAIDSLYFGVATMSTVGYGDL